MTDQPSIEDTTYLVYAIASKMGFKRNDSSYADAISDGMLGLCLAHKQWDGRGQLGAYCHQMVSWYIMTGLKQRNHHTYRNGPTPEHLQVNVSYIGDLSSQHENSQHENSAHQLASVEINHILDKAGMDPRLRRIVAMLYEGYSRAEVASELGISRQRVGKLVESAREILGPVLLEGPREPRDCPSESIAG